MPRSITPAALAAMAAGSVSPFFMAAIEFTSGTVYLWTGIGTVTWNGHDWTGIGTFGGVSAITQTNEMTAENLTLAISGVPAGLVSSAISECRINYSVEVWVGLLDDTGAIIIDPVKAFSGHMDVPTIQDNGDTVTISITAENELISLQLASARRYTQDDQQINYAGDNGFLFVPAIQEWNGAWGTPGGGVVGSGLPAFMGGSNNPNFFTNKID